MELDNLTPIRLHLFLYAIGYPEQIQAAPSQSSAMRRRPKGATDQYQQSN